MTKSQLPQPRLGSGRRNSQRRPAQVCDAMSALGFDVTADHLIAAKLCGQTHSHRPSSRGRDHERPDPRSHSEPSHPYVSLPATAKHGRSSRAWRAGSRSTNPSRLDTVWTPKIRRRKPQTANTRDSRPRVCRENATSTTGLQRRNFHGKEGVNGSSPSRFDGGAAGDAAGTGWCRSPTPTAADQRQ